MRTEFNKKGSIAGYTWDGRPIIVWYCRRLRSWSVATNYDCKEPVSFPTRQRADEYIQVILDNAASNKRLA